MKRLLLLLLLALAGCRFDGVPAPDPWPQALRADRVLSDPAGALPMRLGVTPVRVTYAPDALFPLDPTRNGAVPDLDRLRGELIAALQAADACERIEARGKASDDVVAVERLAWEKRDDLLLEVELRSYHQEYLGHSNYVLWFLTYVWWVWPAWYMPVDLYGVGIEAHVRLRGIQRDAPPLLERTYLVDPKANARELTPDDRELAGFLDLGALWNVETSLEASNWRAIERHAGPHGRRDLFLQILRDVASRVQRPVLEDPAGQGEAVMRKIRRRFALVVGVSEHADEALGSVPFAREDAEHLARFWESPAGGGLVRGRELHLLTDASATRSAILAALTKIAKRAAPADEVLIYFAGQGASLALMPGRPPDAGGGLGGVAGAAPANQTRPLFLAHDAVPADLASTALGLDELGAALSRLPARRVLLAFDASFCGEEAGRTHAGDGAPCRDTDLALALRLTRERAAVFAARSVARPLSEASHGLFTCLLLEGLSGQADADEDGATTLTELWAFLAEQVPHRAALEGFEQLPFALGIEKVRLQWPR